MISQYCQITLNISHFESHTSPTLIRHHSDPSAAPVRPCTSATPVRPESDTGPTPVRHRSDPTPTPRRRCNLCESGSGQSSNNLPGQIRIAGFFADLACERILLIDSPMTRRPRIYIPGTTYH